MTSDDKIILAIEKHKAAIQNVAENRLSLRRAEECWDRTLQEVIRVLRATGKAGDGVVYQGELYTVDPSDNLVIEETGIRFLGAAPVKVKDQ